MAKESADHALSRLPNNGLIKPIPPVPNINYQHRTIAAVHSRVASTRVTAEVVAYGDTSQTANPWRGTEEPQDHHDDWQPREEPVAKPEPQGQVIVLDTDTDDTEPPADTVASKPKKVAEPPAKAAVLKRKRKTIPSSDDERVAPTKKKGKVVASSEDDFDDEGSAADSAPASPVTSRVRANKPALVPSTDGILLDLRLPVILADHIIGRAIGPIPGLGTQKVTAAQATLSVASAAHVANSVNISRAHIEALGALATGLLARDQLCERRAERRRIAKAANLPVPPTSLLDEELPLALEAALGRYMLRTLEEIASHAPPGEPSVATTTTTLKPNAGRGPTAKQGKIPENAVPGSSR